MSKDARQRRCSNAPFPPTVDPMMKQETRHKTPHKATPTTIIHPDSLQNRPQMNLEQMQQMKGGMPGPRHLCRRFQCSGLGQKACRNGKHMREDYAVALRLSNLGAELGCLLGDLI